MFKNSSINIVTGLVFSSVAILSGCGGNAKPTISGIEETYVEPALGIVTINAVVEDEDNDPLTLTWSQTSGDLPLWETPPQGEQIQIKLPVDSGEDQSFGITLSVNDGTDTVTASTTIIVPTSVIPNILSTSEDDGTSELLDTTLNVSAPSLNSQGILEKSNFEFAVLFESDAGVALDAGTVEAGLAAKETVTDITHLFSFNDVAGALVISGANLDEFYSLLGEEQALLDISAYDTLGHDVSMQIAFYYGYGEIQGVLQNSSGEPFTALAGETIELNGSFKSTTYSTTVDENGGFQFIDLPSDTYNLRMITADFKIAAGSILINQANAVVTIDPDVIDLSDTAPLAPAAKAFQSQTQNATAERLEYHNEVMSAKKLQVAAVTDPALLLGTISSVSDSEGVAITNKLNLSVPKNITEVQVIATVDSEEFPQWTTVQSQYNDAWQYYFVVDGQVFTRQGNVNSTHASTGSVTYTSTVSVNQDPNSPPAAVALFTSATNIGDSVVPTTVTLEVAIPDQLVINKFRHTEGLGLGASGRWHIGLDSSSTKKWEAEVNFSPADSMLTTAECVFRYSGGDVPINDITINGNGPGKAELVMGFSGASVPSLGNTHGNVDCEFEAIDNQQQVIQTAQPTVMDFTNGKSTIIPLSRYGSGNRYGGRDIGSDDWMRFRTRAYMSGAGSALIYNDASREHGGCFVKDTYYSSYNVPGVSCSPAIRDHASHKDGTSVDALYPTATHVNPKANLRSVLAMASSDVNAANEVATWVNEARVNLSGIAADSDVLFVYVAKVPWLKDLLVSGVDETGILVPGLTAWVNKPAAIRHHKGHDNHIHIEFNK